jgi:hypothetical protein
MYTEGYHLYKTIRLYYNSAILDGRYSTMLSPATESLFYNIGRSLIYSNYLV